MFEKILGRLLNQLLGEYVEGFDSNNLNLSLWTGEVNIENVRLKKDILIKLGLPISVKYSFIRSLRLKIPWKSLTSNKTEVYIDGVYAVLGYIPESEWTLRDEKLVDKRKKEIEDFRTAVLQRYSDQMQKKSNESSDGYTSKLVLKVIDNLQVEVKDIHLRFQDQEEEEYAFGVTLEHLKIHTVNKDGVEQYIDRTTPEHHNEPLRKHLQLKNMGIYWSRKAQMTNMAQTTEAQIQQRLQTMVQKNASLCPYIVLINCNANLLQGHKGNFAEPQTNLHIQIESVHVDVDNRQLQQMVGLFEKFQRFSYRVRMTNRAVLSPEVKAKMIDTFTNIYSKYYGEEYDQYDPVDLQKLDQILEKIPTTELMRSMKKQILDREKKRMIIQKEHTKGGWFTYGRKQLTEAEVKDIDDFLVKNFNAQYKPIQRPEYYFYLVVELSIKKAEFMIGSKQNHLYDGIAATVVDTYTKFMLRQGDYKLKAFVSDLRIDIFTTDLTTAKVQRTCVFHKTEQFRDQKYLEIELQSNPINHANMDLQMTLNIKASIIIFNPELISRLKSFSKVKVNAQNKQAAIEKFGEIKSKTSANFSRSVKSQDTKPMNINISVTAPLLIIPFSPGSKEYCWGLNMGMLQIHSEPELLQSTNISKEVYNIKLEHLNFGWFSSVQGCTRFYQHGVVCRQMQNIVEDFAINLVIEKSNQMYKPKLPKLAFKGSIPSLQLKLSEFSYDKLKLLSKSFTPELNVYEVHQQQKTQAVDLRVVNQDEKQTILNRREKLGILYKRNNTSKLWQRFTCVLTGNYLYLYGPSSKINYQEYIYIKNSDLLRISEIEAGRPNTICINNKVDSGVMLSFDKLTQMEEWEKIIISKRDPQLLADSVLKDFLDNIEDKPINTRKIELQHLNYEQINFEVAIDLKEIRLIVYEVREDSNWLDLRIRNFNTLVDVYEARLSIFMVLGKLDIYDHIISYKNPELDFFLKTDINTPDASLITVNILQVDPKDPIYKQIDNDIKVVFGIERGNWKPQTVSKMFRFFLPNKQLDKTSQELIGDMLDDIYLFSHQPDILSVFVHVLDAPLRIHLNISIDVQEITLNLINKNNRVKMYELLFKRLTFRMVKSNEYTDIQVNAGNLLISDCSGYPNTILSEEEYKPNMFTFLQSLQDSKQYNLVEVHVKILNNVEVGQKDLFVDVQLNTIYIDFMKQPFLRVVDYIIYQFIPSLSSDPEKPKQKPQHNQSKKQPPIKHPEYSTWALKVQAVNSVVRLRPSVYEYEQIVDLHINQIKVSKDNFERPYCTNPNTSVLVTAYIIDISQTYLSVRDHQITNGLDLSIIIDSIEQPRYYRREYGDDFKDGLRVHLKFGSFLLRISNRDMNTILKCLKWNVFYNDNCDRALIPQSAPKNSRKAEPAPMYLDFKAEKITVVPALNNYIPISCFSIHRLIVNMVDLNQQGMTVEALVGGISASSFTRSSAGGYIERGILKYSAVKVYDERDLLDIPELVRLLYLRDSEILSVDLTSQLVVRVTINEEQGLVIEARSEQFCLCLELLTFLSLSKIADSDDSLTPPPPRLPSSKKLASDTSVKTSQAKQIRLFFKDTSISIRNSDNDEEIGVSGDLQIHLLILPARTKEQVEINQRRQSADVIENSKTTVTANELMIFLSQTDAKGTTKKRTILAPLNLLLMINENYSILQDRLTITKDMIVQTDLIGLKVSVRDLMSIASVGQQNVKNINEWRKQYEIATKDIEGRDAQKEITIHRHRKSMKLSHRESSYIQPLHQEDEQRPNIIDINQPIINHTAEVSFKEFELEIINDCKSMFVPVMQLLLWQTKPALHSSATQTNIGTIISLEVKYFNPRSARWQPILEGCRLTIGYIINKGLENESSEISVMAEEDEPLNINISSQMIRSLEESINLAKIELKSTEKRVFEDANNEELQVSPYVFENMTNTPMDIVVPDNPRRTTSTNFIGVIASGDKPEFRTKTLPSRYKGSVYIPVQSNEITLKIKQATYAVNINIFGKRRICDSKYFVQCKVEKLNRLVKFTGDLYIVNSTNQNIYVQPLEGSVEQLKPNTQLPLEDMERIAIGSEPERLSNIINMRDLGSISFVSSSNGQTHFNINRREKLISDLASKKFYVNTPLKIVNCLPRPILMQVSLENTHSIVAAKPIKSQSDYECYRFGHAKQLSIKICAPGYLWTSPLSIRLNINKQIDIVLKDRQQNPTVIKVAIVEDDIKGTVLITFFTTAYLINDTPYDLLVYSLPKQLSKQPQYKIAGQISAVQGEQLDHNLIMMGAEVGTLLKFAQKSTPQQLSSVVRIDQLGYNQAVIEIRQSVNGRFIPTYLTLGVDIEVKEMHKDSDVLTKEVRVTTRHVIVNKTGFRLYYKQVGTEDTFQLEKDQRRVAFLLDKDPEKRKVIFRTHKSGESAPISLKGLGTIHFYVIEGGDKIFMRMIVRVTKSFVFLVVERLNPQQAPYQISNSVKKLTVRIPQLDEELNYKQRINFSWKNPDDSHILTLRLLHEESQTIQSVELDPDQVNTKQSYSLDLKNGKTLKLELINQISNNQDTRIITIRKEPDEPVVDKLLMLIRAKFSRIGVSFILNHQTIARPYEFIYGYLQNLELVHERTQTTDTFQVRLRFMQIDQNYPNELMTPVIFTPQKYNMYINSQQNNSLINIVVKVDRRSQRHLIIKEIAVEVKDVTVRVSQNFIKVLRDISRDTTKNQTDYLIKRQREEWLKLQLPQQDGMLYIQQMSIFPFHMELTCHIKPQALQQNRGYVFEEVAIQAFGVAFTNIEEAIITIKGITLNNSYQTIEGIINKLTVHYRRNFFNQVYKVFGSLNIIGNPMGLFNNITTGLTDLIQRPVEGAVKGPIELGRGIVSGAHSLVAHTIGGALNSLSQITQSVSNALTILCFDKHYEMIRDKERMLPPTGILDGLGKSVTSLYVGMREGIIGVIGQPIRGVRNNGPIGGALGLLTGVGGVIIKPVTGVLDALSKTSQGFRTFAMGHEDHANTQRIRNPRVLYGSNAAIKSYSTVDSQMYQALEYLDRKFANSPFIQSFMINEERSALVVLQSYIVMFNLADRSVEWTVDMADIDTVMSTETNNDVNLLLKEESKFKLLRQKNVTIECANRSEKQDIARLLLEMIQLRERVIEEAY